MTDSNQSNANTPREPIRWWPAGLILLLATIALVWVWLVHDTWRQQRVILSAQVIGCAILLLLTWALAFARLPRSTRVPILAGFVGLLLFALLAFNIRGVTGDMLPILEWRWKSAPEPPVPPDTAVSAAPAMPDSERPITLHTTHDYPQFLGPNRDATTPGPALDPDWGSSPPELLWRRPVGAGWSAFSVSGSIAVTQEQQADLELVVACELLSGRRLWTHSDHARYFTTIAGEGPRASPTIHNGRVYTMGATGILNCLELHTGTRLWSVNVLHDNDAAIPQWGMAGSPLVHGPLVIVNAGGSNGRSLVAYDKQTGARVWSGGNDPAGYSSPRQARFNGHDQILIFNGSGLAAHHPADGRLLWRFPWMPQHPHVAMPVVLPDNRVLISTGYGTGSVLLQVEQHPGDEWAVAEIWRSIGLKAKFTNVVRHGRFIYGLDDGIMVCLDSEDGSRRWKDGRYGHGQVILVDNLLIVLTERGAVVLIEPVPEELRELGRFTALKGKTWNPPALAGDLLLVRNDQEAACYRLPLFEHELRANPATPLDHRLRGQSE